MLCGLGVGLDVSGVPIQIGEDVGLIINLVQIAFRFCLLDKGQ